MPDPTAFPSDFNLAEYVLAAGTMVPEKAALEVIGPAGSVVWTYAELRAAVLGTARGLLDFGLTRGDRVLMRLGNEVGFPIAYLGAIAAGLVPIPTSAQLTGPEITGLATSLEPALVIAGDGIPCPDHPAPLVGADTLLSFRELPPAHIDRGDPHRPAYLILTSGTSGRARAVVHAHRAILARRRMWEGWYGLRPDDRLCHAGAFNWTYTLGTGLMDPWSIGATALIPEAGTPATALPALLARAEATIFAAAPGVYRQMLRSELPAMPRLRHGLSAGEKLPETLRNRWVETTGTALHEAFGMSECSTFISGSPSRAAEPDTLGWPQPGRRIALVSSEGAPVPRGEPGIIAIDRSEPGLMLGYDKAAEETAVKFCGDWFLTGDMAVETEGGAYRYLGRGDDMMNAGGFRVSPIEVEAALMAHPGIREAAACELRVSAEATVIGAFWVGPDDIDAGAIARFLAPRLARYKQPRQIERVEALPRGANNKILRRVLRTNWEARHGRDT